MFQVNVLKNKSAAVDFLLTGRNGHVPGQFIYWLEWLTQVSAINIILILQSILKDINHYGEIDYPQISLRRLGLCYAGNTDVNFMETPG